MTTDPRKRIDYTKINDITRHRYKFWCMFPNGETIRNEFAVPGEIAAKEADLLAQLAWAESLLALEGRRIPQKEASLLRHGSLIDRRLTRGMIDHAIQNGHYTVARPGEQEFVG